MLAPHGWPSATESWAVVPSGSSQTYILMSNKEVDIHRSAAFNTSWCWLSSTQVSCDSHKNLIHLENTKHLSLRHSLCLLSLLCPLLAATPTASQQNAFLSKIGVYTFRQELVTRHHPQFVLCVVTMLG